MAWTNGYTYKRTVTVDNTKVSGSANHPDFTMLFKGTYSDLADTSNGGKVVNNGSNLDIRFESTGDAQLKHHVVEWDNTDGTIVAWVKVPTLDPDDDTVVNLYYGKSLSGTEQDEANTWKSGFKMVLPLNEASGTRYDFTTNSNDTTTESNMAASTGTTKIYGTSADFNGSTSYMYVDDDATLDITDALTVSAWVYADSQSLWDTYMVKGRNTVATDLLNNYEFASHSVGYRIYWREGDNTEHQWRGGSPTTGSWMYLSASLTFGDSSNPSLRKNGSADAGAWIQGNNDTAPATNSDKLVIGLLKTDAIKSQLDGKMQQLRIYNGVLSDDWIDTEYANQNAPATFYTLGAETESSGIEVVPPAGDVTVTGVVPTVTRAVSRDMVAGDITIVGNAPAVVVGIGFAVPAGEVTLTGNAPAVKRSVSRAVSVGNIAITGIAPTIPALRDTDVSKRFKAEQIEDWIYYFDYTPLDDRYVTITGATMQGTLNMDDHPIIGVGYLDFDLVNGIAQSEGRLKWNADDGTLEIGMAGGNVNLQLGQEIYLPRGKAIGSDIDNGKLVYISGASGFKPELTLAKADVSATSKSTVAMATEDISQNSNGYYTAFGLVRDVPVPTATFSDGDILYLSATTAGAFTNVSPVSPNRIIRVGYVITAHNTEGIVFIDIQPRSNSAKHIEITDSGGYFTGTEVETALQEIGNALIYHALVTKTADYTATIDDEYIIADATSNTVTITLPDANGIDGRVYTVKCIDDTYAVTIQGTGGDTIDGDATITLGQYDAIKLISNGLNWLII